MKQSVTSLFLFSFIYFISHPSYAVPLNAPLTIAIPKKAKIDINTANADALIHALKGIGKKRAEAIVHHREEYGLFKAVEDLGTVKGIGEAFVKRNQLALNDVFEVKS